MREQLSQALLMHWWLHLPVAEPPDPYKRLEFIRQRENAKVSLANQIPILRIQCEPDEIEWAEADAREKFDLVCKARRGDTQALKAMTGR
jgi:hypothetical protein